MTFLRSIYGQLVVLLAGSAVGWALFVPSKPAVTVTQSFREMTGGKNVPHTAVVEIQNTASKPCTVWQCYIGCACSGSVDGLPLKLAPGETGSILLRVDIPQGGRYCKLEFVSDAPDVDECAWDLTKALEIKGVKPKVEGPIPDPMFEN